MQSQTRTFCNFLWAELIKREIWEQTQNFLEDLGVS